MKIPIISLIRKSGYFGIALLCASGAIARAGDSKIDSKESKTVEPLTTDSGDPWKFTLGIPGWLANTAGTVGLDGINSHVYLGVRELIPRLDMIATVSAEVRKGRFGMYGDLLYVSASDGIGTNGLIQKLDVRLDEYLLDLELNYRVLEGPKGYLDVRAGVRYTNIFTHMSIAPNNYAINQFSTNLVDDVAARVRERLSELDLKSRLKSALGERIRQGLAGRLDGLRPNDSTLSNPPIAGGRLSEAERLRGRRDGVDARREGAEAVVVNEAVRKVVDRHVDDLAAALREQLNAKTDALKAAAQNKIDNLKKKIANQIAATLKDKLNNQFNLDEQWWDPYVGLAGRYNLNKAWYLTGKGDIGGFSVGSQLTYQLYGGLGCQVTRYISLEAGYRYLYTDYHKNGFLYDVTQSGAQITAGIAF